MARPPHKEGPLLLERERREVFFVGSQMKERVGWNRRYTKHGRVDLPNLR
jgi:hypothetical protein